MDNPLSTAAPVGVSDAVARAGTGETPSSAVGGLLAWTVTVTGAHNAVEVGCASGVSGLWTVAGFPGRGTLTSVEPDPHRHSLATQAYEDAGLEDRVRSILGDPATVLDRLTDGHYDLVLLQLGPAPTPEQLDHAGRLLRDGGALVVRTTHETQSEATADAVREREDFDAVALLPLDGGVVLATRVEPGE
ncbi:MAG: class I SAM-dependent methyltransferase [Nitriliruptorales bacterium]|nr:class I SAM-dependent methyltransferase [Nitriliruptorales bacterium]